MRDLFSSTTNTHAKSHTELVRAIEQSPALECAQFYGLAARAIEEYFKEQTSLYDNVEARTKSIARAMTAAIGRAVEYLADDEEPEEEEPLEKSAGFEPVTLMTRHSGGDHELDTALQNILGKMDNVTQYVDEEHTTYLFRISLGDTQEDLIPEVTRTNMVSLHRPEYLPDVVYELSFAAYER